MTFNIKEQLKKLPDKPGVYIMKDSSCVIIYIGKAVVLKNRVRQYFHSLSGQSPKVAAMVSQIASFEYIVTDSEMEALILECNLIKKYQPRYNILLKDDKSYPHIKITINEPFPRVFSTRKVEKDGAKYFGPYPNVSSVRHVIELIKELFPVKTCNKVFPRDIGKARPCLNFHIKRCVAPCQGNVTKQAYGEIIKNICDFLEGKQQKIVERLNQMMDTASQNLDFEAAAIYRDKINGIKHILQKQKVMNVSLEDQDVVGFAKNQIESCVQVMFIRGGMLIGSEHFIFEADGCEEIVAAFIKQFYGQQDLIPKTILLPCEITDQDLLSLWLGERGNHKVNLKVPQKGEKLDLVKLATKNAEISLNRVSKEGLPPNLSVGKALEHIAKLAGMPKMPHRIEAYDISNTGTSETVGGMVVFQNGSPNKKEYRKFKIKFVDKPNDYMSMQQVLFRRFKHLGDGSKAFSQKPDAVFIDGGTQHVNAALEVLNELGLNIPVFGMVKDKKHKTRGLVYDGVETDLSNDMDLLRFVTSVQNEVHRFSISYNKSLRSKRQTESALDEIPGIAGGRKVILLKAFGSIGAIKSATTEELMKVKGISQSVADAIYNFFH